MIGGSGEKKTLKLVAKYADACNLFAVGKQEVQKKLDILKNHCENCDRNYETIEKTILFMGDPLEDSDGFLSQMEQYKSIGIDRVILRFVSNPAEYAQRFADTLTTRVLAI